MSESVLLRLEEASSTNTILKQMQQKEPLPEWSVVMTEFQTLGRGQMGNSWFSSKGKNMLLSLLLYPRRVKAKDQFIISRIVSLAIIKVLRKYTKSITIKWPNDIYWNDKKIAGILIENSLIGKQIDYTIVGLGLNVNEDEFPAHLPNAVSLKQIMGPEFDREQLLLFLRYEFFKLYQSMERGEVAAIEKEYMQHLYRKGGVHWYADAGGRFEATIKKVLSSGHLVLATYPDEEERTYAFKEVAFVTPDR